MAHASGKTPTRPVVIASALVLAAVALACGGASGDDAAGVSGGTVESKPSAPSKPTKPPPATGPTVKVAFAATLPDGAFTPVTEAAIASTPELYVVADWTGVTLTGTERMDLLTPAGTLYYTEDISFQDRNDGSVRVSSLPDGTRRVTYHFLIWGTDIYAYARTGAWTASVTLLGGNTSGTATVVLK